VNVLSLQDLALPDLNLPVTPANPQPHPGTDRASAEPCLGDYFREPEQAPGQAWLGRNAQPAALIDALRSLFQGPAGLVRLRLWMLMTLAEHPSAWLSRTEIDALWQALRPDALGTAQSVLQRFRDTGLLAWDDGLQQGRLSPLARQLANTFLALAHTEPEPEALRADLELSSH